MLSIAGAFVPAGTSQPATLVIELSKKPLIILFWLGALIAFSGGLLSMRYGSGRNTPSPEAVAGSERTQPEESPSREPVAGTVAFDGPTGL